MIRKFLALLIPAALVVVVGLTIQPNVAVVPTSNPTITIANVDAHDGTVYQDNGTYYFVGTRYTCSAGSFNWGVVPTTFCGYSVFSAPALVGPWTYVRDLFPVTDVSPYNHTTWQHTCGDEGQGCFNPRMVKRPDGVWVLWFNVPYDSVHFNANGYMVMGCNGPAGPCGASAGPPYGSVSKPAVYKCTGAGDFSIVVDGATAWIICNTGGNYTLVTEKLDGCWCNGINFGVYGVAGLTNIEGAGAYKGTDGLWIVTFSDPACGYCSGSATGFAYASALEGPWLLPVNVTLGSGDVNARRKLSANSCGGQPRTVTVIDGQAYQVVDTWAGTRNETVADTLLIPLERSGFPLSQPQNGTAWQSPFKDFACM